MNYDDYAKYADQWLPRDLTEETRSFLEAAEDRRRELTDDQKAFFCRHRYWNSPLYEKLKGFLKTGEAPSVFFRNITGWAEGTCILSRYWEAFLRSLDRCTLYPYPQGLTRRPFRSDRYSDHLYSIMWIVGNFSNLAIIDADLCDILSGNIPPDALAYTRELGGGYCAELIAYELDHGNERLKSLLTACLRGDEGAPRVNRHIFLGVQMSGCEALYGHLGRLLLAARLEEGLRQSILEAADEGTIPAFRAMLGVIAEHGLIRYSSVRRAVGVWSGLGSEDPKDLERISDKTLSLMLDGINRQERLTEMLGSPDSMELYTALWTKAVSNVYDAVKEAGNIIENGSRHQAAVCCFFASVIDRQNARLALAGKALKRFPEDEEIFALCLPAFLSAFGVAQVNGYWRKMDWSFDPQDAEWIPLMKKRYQTLKSREQPVPTDVFPWLQPVVRKPDIALVICGLSMASGDDRIRDEALLYLPQLSPESNQRACCMEAMLSPALRPAQKAALTEALADKSSDCRRIAYDIAEKLPPSDLDFRRIEDHLRLKQSDLRTNCLKLLYRQGDDDLYETVRRLLKDPLFQKRAAGYDLILRIASDPDRVHLKDRCIELIPVSPPPDPQERMLWESVSKAAAPERDKEDPTDRLFGDADRYTPDTQSLENDPSYRDAFLRLFPDSAIANAGAPADKDTDCPSCAQARLDLKKLNDLIEAHREEPINDHPITGDKQLLGYGTLPFPALSERNGVPFPLADVWEDWYAYLGCPERLIRAIVLLLSDASTAYGNFDASSALIDRLFGAGFRRLDKLKYSENIKEICAYLYRLHGDGGLMFRAGVQTGLFLVGEAAGDQFVWALKSSPFLDDGPVLYNIVQCVTNQVQVSFMLSPLLRAEDRNLSAAFTVREALFLRFKEQLKLVLVRNGRTVPPFSRYGSNLFNWGAVTSFIDYREGDILPPSVLDDLKAVRAGVLSERALLRRLFESADLKGGLILLSRVSLFVRTREGETELTVGRGWNRRFAARRCLNAVKKLTGKTEGFDDGDLLLMSDADRICQLVIPVVLEEELRRGDTPARWSNAVFGIQYIRGADLMGRIIAALGKSPLKRNTDGFIYFNREPGREDTLCYLLSVCIPAPGDDPKALEEIIAKYKISERRLTEIAMFNTSWTSLIGEYLKWPGFVSAVYFFIAHMNERFDEEREAQIARFTPLTAEELNDGAFDIDWFRKVWEESGEKRFALLYDAARYITDNARHTRARKYADASLGRLKTEDAEKAILDKRNKDLLMAYALIPLSDEKDLLRRFLFIRKYMKDSSQFGAQRSASERRAAEMALVNLAARSGDRDVTRLSLRMEGLLTDSVKPLFEPVLIEDIKVSLVIDPSEGVRVNCEKDGKILKAVPARLKKHPEILRLTEGKKQLTEQALRFRRFLEDAMTEGVLFTAEELRALRRNQMIRPMIDSLVMKTEAGFGLPCDEGLTGTDGAVIPWEECAAAQVAHPRHLFDAGVWPAWQRRVFEARIVQPFKQVFRELYVPSEDEKGREESRRYVGYQIQPQKAAKVLRARRWTSGAETGLQKVFYRENIVALLIAATDWFTPSDIEAPTLESVRFFDRLSGKPLKTDQVPALVFSEVMRDADLAVSVAYAGGVDPETSRSTIEMRTALLRFVLPMFDIHNVRLEHNHAVIQGKLASYSVHLGSGVVHLSGGPMLLITAVRSQHRGRLFLPFADDDPRTAEILTKILFLAEDHRIRDPGILNQIR